MIDGEDLHERANVDPPDGERPHRRDEHREHREGHRGVRPYLSCPGCYTAQWVQTTAGALFGVITGQPQGGISPVVAVQIRGTLTAAGQNRETEVPLLILPIDGTIPPGSMTTRDAINLAQLGAVHRI